MQFISIKFLSVHFCFQALEHTQEAGGRDEAWNTKAKKNKQPHWEIAAVSPALVQADHTAVVLIPSIGIEHPCMHDVSNWHVQVIGEEILQEVQGLVTCRLQH